MQPRKVISVGADRELLWLRHSVLKAAGFNVVTSLSEEDALASIRQGHCDALLMCYSLSKAVRHSLAEHFRNRCPQGRIVAITNEKLDQPEYADSFVYGVEGPEALIDAISVA